MSRIHEPKKTLSVSSASRPSRAGLAERLLLALSRDSDEPDYPTTTAQYTVANALNFPRKSIPNFDQRVRERTILDYGCGPGWQAVAMAVNCGASQVVGIDINQKWLQAGRSLAEREGCQDAVSFVSEVPPELLGTFDVAISISSFEHFGDPEANLREMREAVRPGGKVIVSFAEPWFSHSGSHMDFFTRVPWVNILFSEKTVMNARSHYRSDGATRYEEVEGGLNRMTLAKFGRLMKTSGMVIEELRYFSTKGLPLVQKIPLVRELLVSSASCVLRKA
jgi:SAM-dependent methyltransferase